MGIAILPFVRVPSAMVMAWQGREGNPVRWCPVCTQYGLTDDQVDDRQRSNVTYLCQLWVRGLRKLMAITAAAGIAVVGRVVG